MYASYHPSPRYTYLEEVKPRGFTIFQGPEEKTLVEILVIEGPTNLKESKERAEILVCFSSIPGYDISK